MSFAATFTDGTTEADVLWEQNLGRPIAQLIMQALATRLGVPLTGDVLEFSMPSLMFQDLRVGRVLRGV